MMEKSKKHGILLAIGIGMMGLALLLLLLAVVRGEAGRDWDWVFYLLTGLVYARPKKLVEAYNTNPWVTWALALPAVLGIILVILSDMGKLPQFNLEMFPVIIYSSSLAINLDDRKEEKKNEA